MRPLAQEVGGLPAWLTAALLVLLATPSGVSQCPGDDGFKVPGACCVPPSPSLPNFPPVTMAGEACCFQNCAVQSTANITITLFPPSPVFCDLYVIPFNVSGGVNTFTTYLIAKYQRTWNEFNPVTGRQVWRFLINADVNYVGGAVPCPVPPCTTAGLPVHFIGSLDYALDCTNPNPTFEAAINLTHPCGQWMHNFFTARPLTGPQAHGDRTYAFVGPAPFNFGTATIPQGNVIGEGKRTTLFSISPFMWDCLTEVPIPQGVLVSSVAECPCPGSSSPPQWEHQRLAGPADCVFPTPNSFTSIPVPPLLFDGLIAMKLGTYTGPVTSYPSGESVSLYIGLMQEDEPCTGVVQFHFVSGVATVGGDFASLFSLDPSGSPITTDKFLDLQNMLLIGGTPTPGIGALFFATDVWGVNVP